MKRTIVGLSVLLLGSLLFFAFVGCASTPISQPDGANEAGTSIENGNEGEDGKESTTSQLDAGSTVQDSNSGEEAKPEPAEEPAKAEEKSSVDAGELVSDESIVDESIADESNPTETMNLESVGKEESPEPTVPDNAVADQGAQQQEVYDVDSNGVAVKGYDVVAYFTLSKPTKGNSTLSVKWSGATWHFANAQHRKLFIATPKKYAPQYGGYCAWAVSRGYTAPIDPNAWKIVNQKLYLNFSLSVQKQWEQDIPTNIALADKNWPSLRPKP